jgi:hypothetical protein
LKKECICILDKELEDCFDDGTPVAALRAVADNYGITVNLTEQNLAAQRKRGEGVARLLEKIYYTQTEHGLPKPEMGRKIAEILSVDIRKLKSTKACNDT